MFTLEDELSEACLMRPVHTKEIVFFFHIQKKFVRVCERFSVKENRPLQKSSFELKITAEHKR